jgi:dTDP-glucose 4,6-dehydratase
MKSILVTGGAGFIGSNFVRLVRRERPEWRITVLDKLTYAGRIENLEEFSDDANFRFVRGDIRDVQAVEDAMENCDAVFNFAAESHVDRSLMSGAAGAGAFVQTDVFGVYVLLEEAKKRGVEKFVQVSTDEVYGDVETGYSDEEDALCPRSPYSAAKAGGELLARSYFVSHQLPVVITRGSNTFGPRQYPEKLLPLFVTNAIDDLPLPLYGDGLQKRDWLHVDDHARGILLAAEKGENGEAYNLGGGNERTNREITNSILRVLAKPETLVRRIEDRPGHDRRYAVNSAKAESLGWNRSRDFDADLEATIRWYESNENWWRPLKSDTEYKAYYQKNYDARLEKGRTLSNE